VFAEISNGAKLAANMSVTGLIELDICLLQLHCKVACWSLS